MDETQGMPPPTLEQIFGSYVPFLMRKGTWCISFMEGSEYIYLLEGEERALLTDTGYGIGNLRALAESLTDKPICVINTHFHPDHSAGNGYWPEVMLSAGWEIDAPSVISPGAVPTDLSAQPYPDYVKKIVHDGDVIDLGGRKILVLEAKPAHCNSSLFLIDEENRIILTGDEYESAQTLLYDNSLNPDAPYDVRERIDNLRYNAKRLQNYCQPFTMLLPNHNGTPIDPSYLQAYVSLCDAIDAGTAQIESELHHRFIERDPKAPTLCRVRSGLCSIFIRKDEILKIYGKGA